MVKNKESVARKINDGFDILKTSGVYVTLGGNATGLRYVKKCESDRYSIQYSIQQIPMRNGKCKFIYKIDGDQVDSSEYDEEIQSSLQELWDEVECVREISEMHEMMEQTVEINAKSFPFNFTTRYGK